VFRGEKENIQITNRMNTTWLIIAIVLLVLGIALAIWAYFQYRRDTQPKSLTGGSCQQLTALPPALTGLSTLFWILAIISIVLIIAAIIVMIMAFVRAPSVAVATVAPVSTVPIPAVTTTNNRTCSTLSPTI
jgi:heme/copper-type cytochrome/quinol oxidase subunit 2